VERYNGFAMSGKDEDWQRGDTAYELSMLRLGGSVPADNKVNPTMFPISESGPYYCMILGAGTLDTICGPRINADGQVIYDNGEPVPGLYGCGNAVAAADPGAYWAGGGTLGMGLTFGFSAGENASSQPDRLSESRQRFPLLAGAEDSVTGA
jgi:predicted oxidoreductase